MRLRFGLPRLPQAIASLTVFVLLLVFLASVDQRVKEKFSELTTGNNSVSSWTVRAAELGDTVATAVQHQSRENSAMVLFATVGGVLFLFMVKVKV